MNAVYVGVEGEETNADVEDFTGDFVLVDEGAEVFVDWDETEW